MRPTECIVSGTLRADGTLQLDAKPNLPPGRVQVVVQPLPAVPQDHPFWDMLQGIWAGQKARGHVPRCAEEVEAARRELREGWARRQRALEHVQDEARRLREQP